MEYLKVFAGIFGIAFIVFATGAFIAAFGLGAVLKVLPTVPFLLFIAVLILCTDFKITNKEDAKLFFKVIGMVLAIFLVVISWAWTIRLIVDAINK